jgi:hypothetical protein
MVTNDPRETRNRPFHEHSAFVQGWETRRQGHGADKNPFPLNSQPWRWWRNGYFRFKAKKVREVECNGI